MKFWDFPDISWFCKILSLTSFGNSWGNSYIAYLLLIITLRFTSGERKVWSNIKTSQNIMAMIMEINPKWIERIRWYDITALNLENGNLKAVYVGYVKFMYFILDSYRFLIVYTTLERFVLKGWSCMLQVYPKEGHTFLREQGVKGINFNA